MIQLLTVSDMRESDKCTIANGTDSKILMYRAGESIYNAIKDLPAPFAIICGNGNNAGDGYVLASLLKKANIDCKLFRITERFSEDGKYYYEQCSDSAIYDEIINIDSFSSAINAFPTIVDCIFGTGFHGEVKEPERSVINAINACSNSFVVSIDINSGLNGDNGLCDICVHSDLTISIGNMKPGHFLGNAKDVCKKIINYDIGIQPVDNHQKIYLTESTDFKEIFKSRANNSNKGSYGYIGLIGGSQCYSGAIRLANMAACAMRSGSGVVKIAAPASLGQIIMPAILESTFYPLSDKNGDLIFVESEFKKLLTLSSIAFGMGIGNSEETQKALTYLLKNYTGTLIIDADGLNALASLDSSLLRTKSCKVILTPHPKEFSRILSGINSATVQSEGKKPPTNDISVNNILCKPIYYAAEYAKANNLIVLLKGSSTIISDGNTSYISNSGCPGMATAGSGDVLSGILAAVCGYNKDNLLLATAATAYMTGLAGEKASSKYGDISMIASDTASFIPEAIMELM